jgi:glutamyl-tRNA(Gln) amidotransferase subunit D
MDMKKYFGKIVEIEGKGDVFAGKAKGIVLPIEREDKLVLKLESGYNIAINYKNIDNIKVLGESDFKEMKNVIGVEDKVEFGKGKKIAIISIGGTIASRVDYSTGGVSSQFTAKDLLFSLPEIQELSGHGLGSITSFAFSNTWSENLTNNDWLGLVKLVEKYIQEGMDGVIVTQGTDTLHYTSSTLSFLLEELGVPVVVLGAQRSSDRPSTDGAYNLMGALKFTLDTKRAGVFVAMHHSIDDETIAIHSGVKVRKMHSSRRDAFRSINTNPVAYVDLDLRAGKIKKCEFSVNKHSNYDSFGIIHKGLVKTFNKLTDEVYLLKVFPGMDSKIIDFLAKEYKIIILEGTGLGHVPAHLFKSIEEAAKKGVLFFMTTQTIHGAVNMNIYSNGIMLQNLGVIGLKDMLPETAFVKAKYLLAKEKSDKKIIELMQTNLKGEILDRVVY